MIVSNGGEVKLRKGSSRRETLAKEVTRGESRGKRNWERCGAKGEMRGGKLERAFFDKFFHKDK